MRYFPISLDTRNKKLLVIGGGKVAYKKIRTLLDSELAIYVIAEEIHEEIEILAKDFPDRIHINLLSIDEGFVFFGYDLLLIATNNESLNQALEKRAQSKGILYLRCDQAGDSSFILNKIVRNGDIVVSVSTGGKNPTVSRIIGKDIEDFIQKYDPKKIQILNEIRKALVAKKKENIPEIMQSLWDKEAITLNEYLEEVDEDKTGISGK